MRLAVLFHRFGPYHVARLRAAAQRGTVIGVELSGGGGEYTWPKVKSHGFQSVTVYPEGDTNTLPATERTDRVEAMLDTVNPDVIAVAGYADKGMLAAIQWGLRRRKPMVLMSDSQYHDEPRRWWKEWVKRGIVSCFGAGFVAGKTHTEYLVGLGIPREKITTGYDVVDNDHFARGADAARADPAARCRLGVPERYFLTCARCVPKKNLGMLIDAFADYRRASGQWQLVLVGDGPLRSELETRIERLGIRDSVHFAGFRQYDELPGYYGLASAFVLPSKQEQWGLVVNEAMAAELPVIASDVCGCAPDLVRRGETGLLVAAGDKQALAEALAKLSADPARAASMGQRGRELIAGWGLERFADGLWQSAANVFARRPTTLGTAVLRVLLRKQN
jgi:glycosyltransferase involved in cell wall biosynthesis